MMPANPPARSVRVAFSLRNVMLCLLFIIFSISRMRENYYKPHYYIYNHPVYKLRDFELRY
jgi:hypothetical protein